MKRIIFATWLCLFCALAPAAELSGVFVADEVKTADGQSLPVTAPERRGFA
jgi:hypothetical protein